MKLIRVMPLIIILALPLLMAPVANVQGAASINHQKIKIVYHNVPLCPVSGMRVDGDHRRYEVIYMTGNIENHIYLASETYTKQFNSRPDFYFQKILTMEQEQ